METIGIIVGFVLLAAVIVLLSTWWVMILLGILASMTGWSCAIGFWPTFIIVLIARSLTYTYTKSDS